jgi:hypothetical protein
MKNLHGAKSDERVMTRHWYLFLVGVGGLSDVVCNSLIPPKHFVFFFKYQVEILG